MTDGDITNTTKPIGTPTDATLDLVRNKGITREFTRRNYATLTQTNP
ncbi:hypothetical protein L13192_12542 [Pyrenophora tritici-repentis]|nr:hypothetical protein L13192_12542 [Pyrenophora tritici-repentis]